MNTTPTFIVWERCVSRKNLIRKAVTTMSITNATTQESLVQYPSPYKVVDGNLCMEVTEKHSNYDRKLSNFTPFIKSELTIDDGATETKYLRLAGKHANGELLPEIEVSGKDFPSFNWLFEKWGAKCILEVGKNIREHLRYAIQQTAEYAEQQFIYQQTGWKKNNGEWYFLLPGDSKFNVSLYAEKSLYLFLLYNCGTVAVAPRSVAETETLYLAYTLDFFALLQKLQINIIHLLLVTKYTFMWVENGVSISHVLLSFS